MLTAILLTALLPLALSRPTDHLSKRYDSVYIYSARDNLCLSVPPGREIGDAVPVASVNCSQAIQWNISPGAGPITVAGFGSGIVLGAGSHPENFGALTIWQDYPGLFAHS